MMRFRVLAPRVSVLALAALASLAACGPEPLPPPRTPLTVTAAGALGDMPPAPPTLPAAPGNRLLTATLSNRIELVTIPRPSEDLFVAVTVSGAGRRAREANALQVLIDALEKSTVVDGSVQERLLDDANLHLSFVQGPTSSMIFGGVPSGKLSTCLNHLAQVVQNPGLRPDDVAEAQADAIARIREQAVTSGPSLDQLAMMMLYGSSYTAEPLAADRIDAVRAVDELRSVHRRYYRPERTKVVVSGDVSHDDVVALVEEAFGPWRGSNEPAPTPRALVPQEINSIAAIMTGSEQIEVLVTFDAPSRSSEDAPRLRVFAEALAGMSSSLLQTQMRERLGHTYGVHAEFATVSVDRGLLQIRARLAGDDGPDDVEDFLTAIRRAVDGELPDELIERAKSTLRAEETYRAFDNRVAASVLSRLDAGAELQTSGQIIEGLERVTVEDVQSVDEVIANARASVILRGHWRTIQYLKYRGWRMTMYEWRSHDGRGD